MRRIVVQRFSRIACALHCDALTGWAGHAGGGMHPAANPRRPSLRGFFEQHTLPYDPEEISEEAFLQQQDSCLDSLQFDEKSTQITNDCVQEAGFDGLATGESAEEPQP